MKFKLLFIVTEDWYFCSHRLTLAKDAMKAGFDVSVATCVQKHSAKIKAAGITLIPLQNMVRSGKNPLNEFKSIIELIQIYKKVKPDIVHHVAMKPMLYGAFAAQFSGIKRQVQAISGFGFVFLSNTLKARLLRLPVKLLLRYALVGKRTDVIVQNSDDAKMAKALGVKDSCLHLIQGSGVNINTFNVHPEPFEDTIYITLVARMLWDKGVGEFVEAVRSLQNKGINLKANLVGEPDPSNPSSIPEAQLKEWHKEGVIDWRGREDDIAKVWSETNIAILPSYREGLPKSLLEAAACGRVMVATDVPGCRSIVADGETGKLVPAKDVEKLAQAIELLIKDKDLRAKMGIEARRLVENSFSDDVINNQIISLYKHKMSV